MEQLIDSGYTYWEYRDGNFDYAVVLYDYASGKIVSSEPRIVISEDLTVYLSDYLDREEMIGLVPDFQRCKYSNGNMYRANIGPDGAPVSIETTGLPPFREIILDDGKTAASQINALGYFPHHNVEKDDWAKRFISWLNNDTLQEALQRSKEKIKDQDAAEYYSDSLIAIKRILFDTYFENSSLKEGPYSNLIVIATYRPWFSAIKELKTVYALIAAVSLISIIVISANIINTYNKQKELEETRSSFVMAMAHDLKTPLTVIRGYAENLLDDTEKSTDRLGKIIATTDEIDDMVSKMLDVSRPDSNRLEMKKEEIVLNELTSEVIGRYRKAIEQRELEYSISDEGRFELIGDRKLLDQMISNLIDNALNYTDKGSLIKIDIDESSLSISNRSQPLSEEVVKHLFELTGGKDGHHGFGLYYAKRVADMHDLKLGYSYNRDTVCFRISK